MLAAFHDLRRGTITEFLHYTQQLDRRDVGISDEKKPQAVSKSSKLSERNAAESTTTMTPKYERLPANTCVRCKRKGHRAIDCPDPDTHTEDEKAAAALRRQAKSSPQGINRVAIAEITGDITSQALWDTGSAVTLIDEQFAQKHNFEVATYVDCVLGGPFGNSCKPIGVTQARITIGDACATVEAEVIENLPYEVMVSLDWRQALPFDYIERCGNGVHSIEFIQKLKKNVGISTSSDSDTQPSLSNFVTELSTDNLVKSEGIKYSKEMSSQPEVLSTDVIEVCGAIDAKATVTREVPQLPSAKEIAQLIQCKPVPEDFTESQIKMSKASLLNNINVFTHPDNDLGLCKHVEHAIELTDQKPVRMQPYSTSDANRRFSWEETQEWIRRGLRVVYSKCMLREKQIPFLGFLISQEGVTIDPQRIAAIKNYTALKTKSEVRSFLGLAPHYRKYIKGFANIARPLTLLTKKDAIVQWMPECQGAMDTLKERLTKPPILVMFKPNLPTQVHVDVSHTALGAVLTQTHGDTTRVVEYASKKVSDSDSHKHSTELEAIAAH
ncbi:hypothetical protein MRX96_009231 [Rhipicephalus microplus]